MPDHILSGARVAQVTHERQTRRRANDSLECDKGDDRGGAEDVIAADRFRNFALLPRRVGPGAESHRGGHRAERREEDRRASQDERNPPHPLRSISAPDWAMIAPIVASMTAPTKRLIGRAVVVTRR